MAEPDYPRLFSRYSRAVDEISCSCGPRSTDTLCAVRADERNGTERTDGRTLRIGVVRAHR
jgi:hypothetical protein